MKTSQVGIGLIHSFESYRSKAYKCPAGVWTIGWGSTRIYGRAVRAGDRIKKHVADAQFSKDLHRFEQTIEHWVTVDLNENQFDALVSLCYNIGSRNFQTSSVVRYLCLVEYEKAANSILMWNKARNVKTGKLRVLRGLTRRREAERELFLSTFYYYSNCWASMGLNPNKFVKWWHNWRQRHYEIKPFNMSALYDV